ncbi:MAG: hypothetical protein F9K48_00875 [Candidatus Brocadia sp.]|nr:MAG: hypothetical protein F9K48_00875 [Candidatus Brocadia sp.]
MNRARSPLPAGKVLAIKGHDNGILLACALKRTPMDEEPRTGEEENGKQKKIGSVTACCPTGEPFPKNSLPLDHHHLGGEFRKKARRPPADGRRAFMNFSAFFGIAITTILPPKETKTTQY